MWEDDAVNKLPDPRPVVEARMWLKECKKRCLPLIMTLSQTETLAEKGGEGGRGGGLCACLAHPRRAGGIHAGKGLGDAYRAI